MKMHSRLAQLIPFILAATQSSLGAIFSHESELPVREFDYIVVGGGNAGAVVASRLTEDPKVNVLVLEAGGSNEGILASQIPFLCPSLSPNTPYDWNFTTTPQTGFNGRTFPYARGYVLGGSTTINFLTYNRGSRDDYDTYARIAGDPNWSWNSVINKWARRNENWVPPSDNHNTTGEYLPSAHFSGGAVDLSLPGNPTPLDKLVLAVTKEYPKDFPYQIDGNAGDTTGISWVQSAIGNGQRSSSATAYLGPKQVARPNLSILLHAQATKVIKTGTSKGLPQFGAVDFVQSGTTSPLIRVRARKEVILSAGSFGSPKLLMLSGIGDKAALKKLGIETIVHNPSVGQNASDHASTPLTIYVNSNDTFADHLSSDVMDAEIEQWKKTHQGTFSNTVTNHIGWLRLPQNDPVLKKYGDPSTGRTSAHYEMAFSNGFPFTGGADAPPPGRVNIVTINLISPSSRGSIALKSSNPFDAPIINPNYLTTEVDLHIMRTGIKAARKFIESKSWKGYFNGYTEELANAKTDAQLTDFIRKNGGAVFHTVGTAAVSRKDAPYGVVNSDLRVKGTVGLRIVDASVIPYVSSGHTQGPVYMVAEMASEVIKSQNK